SDFAVEFLGHVVLPVFKSRAFFAADSRGWSFAGPETSRLTPDPPRSAKSGAKVSAFPTVQRGIQVVRHAERAHVDALVDAPGQSSQHLARTTFGHACRALRDQRLHAAGPLHGQVQLACQRIAAR